MAAAAEVYARQEDLSEGEAHAPLETAPTVPENRRQNRRQTNETDAAETEDQGDRFILREPPASGEQDAPFILQRPSLPGAPLQLRDAPPWLVAGGVLMVALASVLGFYAGKRRP